jgi:exodeoxyribonuclease V beta subunit
MSHPHFDLLHSPISGRILVEASAGTGKTYTIAALVVRLIVEKQLEIEAILVVTFTEAATAELHDRIRRRLVEALELFTTGIGSDDFLLPLYQRSPDRDDARRRLQRALISFDQAAIHTIHGFCQRVLRDRAFEARALFDTELVTDLSDFEQQLADDFWRTRSITFTQNFADYLLGKNYGPDRLYQLQRAARRAERILPESPAPALGGAEKVCAAHLVHLIDTWSSEREAILADFLACAPGMHKTSFTSEKIHSAAAELDLYFSVGSLWGGDDGLKKFAAPKANKGKTAPSHPFFADCAAFVAARQELSELYNRSLLALQREFLLWRESEAGKRKARQNLRTYDDLLSEVASSVTTESGAGLLQALQTSYQAILIDEFQDTDPIQYAIFGTLCPDASRTLFLIGDPKQAIYSFRGADIFTYLAATRHVEYHYTLGVNYRSAPVLVDAVSTLFARENPFLFEEIPYPPVQGSPKNSGIALIEGRKDFLPPFQREGRGGDGLAVESTNGTHPPPNLPLEGGGTKSSESAQEAGSVRPPLQLWFVDRPTGKAANKEASTERIVSAVAAEIVRLLNSGARLRTDAGERPLSAGDIAVLVRSNRQAAAVQEQLLACGVPAVRQGTESLFAAPEVEALLRTLAAIADSGDTALARGALASGLLDCDADALAQSGDDPVILDSWLQRLRDYHELWARRGITSLSGALFAGEELGVRSLTQPDGERRLTNLRHAFEVLHCAESREGLGMAGLLSWFSRQIADPPEGEEYQLRLETDERAVQVVTIHRSKGLEYPVCFVPFCWNGSQPIAKFKNSPFTFHAPSAGEPGELTLDLGSPEEERVEYRAINVREALAENLRLLYVAMTRAQACVYLVWGGLAGAESSAPAWLLHGPETVSLGAEVAQTEEHFKKLDDAAIRERLLPLLANGAGEIVDLPPYPQVERLHFAGAGRFELVPLLVPTAIRNDWRLSSYSALVAASTHLADGEAWKMTERVGAEGAARLIESIESIESGPTIHTFPRGADPGSCLHDIFEVINFSAEESEGGLIEKTLSAYALDPGWSPVVREMLRKVLHVPLDNAELQLCRVSRRDRCSEMGFFLPLTALRAAGLAAVFRRHQADLPDPRLAATIASLNFETVSGMLRGFIDLVFTLNGRFYLIDWKSNHLGPSSAAYTHERMLAEMLSSGYILQYHLYCVALHRHLHRTLPGYDYESHFGGVFYLFLRGVDASGSSGVFRDRPTFALINDLDALFAGKEAL